MRLSRLAPALGALLVTTTPALAQMPQTPGSNISITRCDPRPSYITSPSFVATPYRSGIHAILALQYQNEAPSAATEVVFGLVSGDKLVASGKDYGTFSKGSTVNREVVLQQPIFPLGPETHCVVLGVWYANGTYWVNPVSLRL